MLLRKYALHIVAYIRLTFSWVLIHSPSSAGAGTAPPFDPKGKSHAPSLKTSPDPATQNVSPNRPAGGATDGATKATSAKENDGVMSGGPALGGGAARGLS